VQLVEILGNRLRAFLDALVLLPDFFGTRIDQQVTLPACGRTDRLDDIVRPDRFLETVVDQGVDVGVEAADAQVGEYRDGDEQNATMMPKPRARRTPILRFLNTMTDLRRDGMGLA
jgi:hypothetical protein